MNATVKHLPLKLDFAEDGEYSIEVDPRTVDSCSVAALRMGFNRISLGVQDFDPDVQRAVNRVQSETQTLAVIEAAHHEAFQSVNVDLIYGLPRRNVIHSLMCDFALSKEDMEMSYLIDFEEYFKIELREIEAMAKDGLVELDAHWITVTAKGGMLVRNICMVFEPYLRMARELRRFPRVI